MRDACATHTFVHHAQALVRIAMFLHMQHDRADHETSTAAAVDKLCRRMASRLPQEALQSSNSFRKMHCYTSHVDAVLRQYESSLRAIYDVYAQANTNNAHDPLQSATMLSFGEWLLFLEHVDMIAMGQVSLFGAKMLFKWSIIRSLKVSSC